MSRRKSAAWQHFITLDDGKNARCNHCNKTVVIANGSTGNLFRHLKLRHPSISVEKLVSHKPKPIPKKLKSASVPTEDKTFSDEIIPSTVVEILHANSIDLPKFSNISDNSSQQPVSLYLVQPYDVKMQEELDKQLLRVIVKNLIPFTIVEDQEFIKFVRMLNSSYVLPSQKALSNNVLVRMHESTVNELKCTLKDIPAVALTTDSWISINKEHLIAFTVHYLNKDLELKSNFLQCFSSLHKLSQMDITSFIKELKSNWSLCNKILAVVTDGSEEIKKAVHNCNVNHVPCFAQILNRIVKAGLAEINPFILKVRNVVQYFKRNSMALSKFYIIQNEMGLSDSTLVKDIPSRWDTTFNMFTNFLKNKVPLLSTIEQLQLNLFQLSSTDFHYLESAIKILVIFNSIKIAMCSEKYFSLSKVPYMIDFMSKQLQDVLKNTELPSDIVKMGNAIKTGLKQFEELEMSELVCQGVLLDPRFKKRGFSNNFFKEACIALRHNVASVREELMEENNEPSSSSKPEKEEIESEYFMDMWSEFESKDSSVLKSHTAAASVEVDAFLNDLYLPVENDPLSYWANISNQNKFPALFELAKRVLCIPATSLPCQLIYSEAGHNFFKKRKYLTSNILFLHHNL